jgi:hypothetical protein
MRYQNWDVLIFPGDSNVPLQEFNTTCHVTHVLGKSSESFKLSERWYIDGSDRMNDCTCLYIHTSYLNADTDPTIQNPVSGNLYQP